MSVIGGTQDCIASVRACVKGTSKQVDNGTGNGTTVRACNKQESCITCNMARGAAKKRE
jgi:hypothetical protein